MIIDTLEHCPICTATHSDTISRSLFLGVYVQGHNHIFISIILGREQKLWVTARAYERGLQSVHRSGSRRTKKGPVNL